MALDITDLYASWSMAHTGTKDTGNGVGLSKPTPGLATWKQNAAPPTGFTQSPVGAWAHGGAVYFVYNGTDGLGKGIYRFTTTVDGALTYDTFASQAALGLVAGDWGNPPCFYDSSDGSVILITYPKSGANNTPIAGKWPMSAWPFTNANHTWQSALSQSYGSYVAGKITNEARGYLGGTYLFLSSSSSGQVHTIDPSDGSVDGTWCFAAVYTSVQEFLILGENAAGNPIGGSDHPNGGNDNVYAWNISDLNNWATTGGILLKDTLNSYTIGDVPHFKRAKHTLQSNYFFCIPVSKHEITSLGLTGCMCWISVRQGARVSEPHLVHYDPDTDTYRECLTANGSTRRSIGNRSGPPSQDLGMFLTINGIPWFVSWNNITQDQEEEDPGGNVISHRGICLIAVGPGVCKFSKTVTADMVPRRLQPTIPTAAKNYLFSTHWAKHGARCIVNGGAPSAWRYGEQELSNLDSVVNGKAAWVAWSSGDLVEIEWKLSAGWPQALDATCYQNPGEVGDPAQLPTNTADVGPPREVVPVLFADAADVIHTLIGVKAEVTLDPYPLHVSVEVE